MRNVQLAFCFFHREKDIGFDEKKLLIQALSGVVGGFPIMEGNDDSSYSVLIKTSIPNDLTFNVIENRLNMALGDNYYFALVIGELDNFPVNYTTHFSYKFDPAKADSLFEKIMLKQADRKDGDINDSILRYKEWKQQAGWAKFDDTELKRKMADGAWRYVRQFTCYKLENQMRINYLNFTS